MRITPLEFVAMCVVGPALATSLVCAVWTVIISNRLVEPVKTILSAARNNQTKVAAVPILPARPELVAVDADNAQTGPIFGAHWLGVPVTEYIGVIDADLPVDH